MCRRVRNVRTAFRVFAPMMTPFDQEERVALHHLEEDVHKYSKTSLAGIFARGSNGQDKSLTENEKLQVLQVVIEDARGHLIVTAGKGCEGTRQTQLLSHGVHRS